MGAILKAKTSQEIQVWVAYSCLIGLFNQHRHLTAFAMLQPGHAHRGQSLDQPVLASLLGSNGREELLDNLGLKKPGMLEGIRMASNKALLQQIRP